MARKKVPYKGDLNKAHPKDLVQTPFYVIEALLPYLHPSRDLIWEPASGKGYIVEAFERCGYAVQYGDIQTGQNFFDDTRTHLKAVGYGRAKYARTVQVTNPPYSIKYEWLEESYNTANESGIPFALLMPTDTIASAKGARLIGAYGIEMIYITPRVNYYTDMYDVHHSSASFPTAWFTFGLNIGKEISFWHHERVANEDWIPLLT